MDRGATSIELMKELGLGGHVSRMNVMPSALLCLRQQRYADEESPEAYNRDSAGKLTELSDRDYLPIIC